MSTLNQRKNYFDLLRVISSFAVVVIHVTSAAMNTTEVSSQTYMANALLNSIMRWAVPVFFMISGALFLDPKREVTTKKLFTKIIPHFVICIIIWGGIYSILDQYLYGTLSVKSILIALYGIITGNTGYHLWFLYDILMLYIAVPIFRLITCNATKRQIEYALAVWFVVSIGVEHMKKMGMEFHLECPVQAVESSSVGAKVICKNKAGETVSFEAEKVLVAIGRKANTAMLDLDTGKLDNDRGRIKVNDKMETSVPGVYAIGDCVMGYAQLAHTASAMGEVAAENICGHEAHYDESTNPTCVYIEPEAASVGLTEEQCKAKGIAYKVGKFPMSANGKALILNGGEGLVKLIAGAKYGEILGMHIIGPRATDLISEGALAIRLEATVDELISTIHSHPTVTETLREAALNFDKRAIHMKN